MHCESYIIIMIISPILWLHNDYNSHDANYTIHMTLLYFEDIHVIESDTM